MQANYIRSALLHPIKVHSQILQRAVLITWNIFRTCTFNIAAGVRLRNNATHNQLTDFETCTATGTGKQLARPFHAKYFSYTHTALFQQIQRLQKLQQLQQLQQYSTKNMCANSKDFCLNDYDIIGFDLDGTLLRYNLNTMVPLECEILRKFLVIEKGYPRSLLDKSLNYDFLQKGLILDSENGNILKLSSDSTILRATHGTKPLTQQQIISIYGADRKWTISSQFFNEPLSTWNGPLSEKIRTLLDYFDIAVALVFAQTIDILDATTECKPPYKVWPDILEGLIQMYSRENFTNGRSAYFDALRAHPELYLERTNEQVLKCLRDLRRNGKALFLLTGSNIDFAHLTASYALGPDWQELFDSVICFAKKPGFFTAQRPYLCVNNLAEITGSEIDVTSDLKLDCVYTQGNWLQLRAALVKRLGKQPNEVRSLYVGDNLIQDVYAPVKHHDLEAIAVCEELLTENTSSIDRYEYKDIVASSLWGSYFCIEDQPTLWASIIAKYSQLCIPLVDTIANSCTTHKIHSDNGQGYYPEKPSSFVS